MYREVGKLMKQRFDKFLAGMLFALSLMTCAGSAMGEPITVMSWNIRLDTTADGINAWPHRKDAVAEMIGSKYDGDIIGLQEVLKRQLDDLQDRLPEYAWVGVGRDDGRDRGEFSPIFYRTDRFRVLATNTYWLSETPELPGSRSWDAAITRVVTWARFEDLSTGRQLIFFNTHYDHRGEQARVESSRLLLDRLADIAGDTPFILTGDLNVTESEQAYKLLADSDRLSDARYVSETGHQGPTASFNDWENLRPDESRIDYIFVSNGIRTLNHRILDDRYEGRFPSDHLPVVSELLLIAD
jgi:endonuclease/exonuclease/phosphatase family metal-dependent hydrolase